MIVRVSHYDHYQFYTGTIVMSDALSSYQCWDSYFRKVTIVTYYILLVTKLFS